MTQLKTTSFESVTVILAETLMLLVCYPVSWGKNLSMFRTSLFSVEQT